MAIILWLNLPIWQYISVLARAIPLASRKKTVAMLQSTEFSLVTLEVQQRQPSRFLSNQTIVPGGTSRGDTSLDVIG